MTGVDRITRAFARCAAEGRPALIPFITAGDPDADTAVAIAQAAAEAGADIIEIGFPFSDPVADGPVIQASYTRALSNGATVSAAIAACARITRESDVPVVVMTALNLVLSRGVDRFCADLAAAGVSALLVPDLLADDADLVATAAADHGLGTVFLAGPSTSVDRLTLIARASTAFIYVVRRGGVTGVGGGGDDLASRIARLRSLTLVPLAVGFGISTAADVAEVGQLADGVIVGSALVDAAHRAGPRAPDVVGALIRELLPAGAGEALAGDAGKQPHSVSA